MFEDYTNSIYTHLSFLKFNYTPMDCGGTRFLFNVIYKFSFIQYSVILSNPSSVVEPAQMPGEAVDRLFLFPKNQ